MKISIKSTLPLTLSTLDYYFFEKISWKNAYSTVRYGVVAILVLYRLSYFRVGTVPYGTVYRYQIRRRQINRNLFYRFFPLIFLFLHTVQYN